MQSREVPILTKPGPFILVQVASPTLNGYEEKPSVG